MTEPSSIEAIGADEIRIFDHFIAASDLWSLRTAILELREGAKQSVASLNIGGWKSEIRVLPELATRVPAAARLLERLTPISRRPIVSSWAMVNTQGARHPWHTHKLSKVTGVLYVLADSDHSPIEFGAPRPDRGDIAQIVRVPAVPGRLVLFPGHVWHQVPEVTGAGVRISLAFDVH